MLVGLGLIHDVRENSDALRDNPCGIETQDSKSQPSKHVKYYACKCGDKYGSLEGLKGRLNFQVPSAHNLIQLC
jgi:hypothetical protein